MARQRVRRARKAREVGGAGEVEEVVEGHPERDDLRVLARVFALRFARSMEQSQDKVAFLIGAGFSQEEVGDMLLMNRTTVRTNLFYARKK